MSAKRTACEWATKAVLFSDSLEGLRIIQTGYSVSKKKGKKKKGERRNAMWNCQLTEARRIIAEYGVTMRHISRKTNKEADRLAKGARWVSGPLPGTEGRLRLSSDGTYIIL